MRVTRLNTEALPGPLPEGELLLWQGSPDWFRLATRCFGARLAAMYFAVSVVWQVITGVRDGTPLVELAISLWAVLPAAFLAGFFLLGLAYLYATSTVYSVTTRRVLIKSGLAFPLTCDIPFRFIDRVGMRHRGKHSGELVLKLVPEERVGYVHLWPNVIPWRLSRPHPTLHALADVDRAAEVLGKALRDDAGLVAQGSDDLVDSAPQAQPATA